MTWQDDYLVPPIEGRIVSWRFVKKLLKDFWVLVPHALRPHQEANEPRLPLPERLKYDEATLRACERIYDASLARIDSLEKKAFGLLSYVTALSAVYIFSFSQLGAFSGTYFLLVPSVLLLLALIISFRCLRVKTIKQVFINDIFRFDDTNKPIGKLKIHNNYLSASIFNESKADNTADMLRAARMVLASSLFLFVLISGAVLAAGNRPEQPNTARILKEQTVAVLQLGYSVQALGSQFSKYDCLVDRMDTLQRKTRFASDRLDSVNARLTQLARTVQRNQSSPRKTAR
ncbi:hypothetical protein D4R75_09680 [bacterium]|nr:MAG: hypothetical protein D4R75_09680 [bacterium]